MSGSHTVRRAASSASEGSSGGCGHWRHPPSASRLALTVRFNREGTDEEEEATFPLAGAALIVVGSPADVDTAWVRGAVAVGLEEVAKTGGADEEEAEEGEDGALRGWSANAERLTTDAEAVNAAV